MEFKPGEGNIVAVGMGGLVREAWLGVRPGGKPGELGIGREMQISSRYKPLWISGMRFSFQEEIFSIYTAKIDRPWWTDK